ncbi:MAG: hypothetical protein H0X45_11095 [Planctomycetes bacterium]|nr:hypothetical protein [Planctomycetota bacterium]
MRFLTVLVFVSLVGLVGCGDDDRHDGHDHSQHADHGAAAPSSPADKTEVKAAITGATRDAEIGCADCIYHVEGVSGCGELAAVIDGKPMLVTGHGLKIHAAGLCKAAKSARLQGAVQGDRFVATAVELK